MTHFRVDQIACVFAFVAVSMALVSCATTPAAGEKVVMTVTKIPRTRQELQHNPALSLALKRGVKRSDVESKRLVISGCYEKTLSGNIFYRQVLSLIPSGVGVRRGDVFKTTAEKAVAGKSAAQYFGRYLQHHISGDADYFHYKYEISNRAYRCTTNPSKRELVVQAYSEVDVQHYDDAKAEEIRDAQISDDELRLGKIAIGDCGIGVESWVVWKVRLPGDMKLKVGDYIEATAGAHEGPASFGEISRAIQRVEKPPLEDFVVTRGRGDFTLPSKGYPVPYKVRCGARARHVPQGGY